MFSAGNEFATLLQNFVFLSRVCYTLPMRRRLSVSAFTLIELMIAIAIIAILAAILIPNFKKARARAQLTTCSTNCKNVATALEVYSVDFDGRYPQNSGLAGLNQLTTGGNLKRLPTCPAAGAVTFVDYESTQTPDAFSFTCVSDNHSTVFPGFPPGNYPQYSNSRGLTLQPE